MDGWNITFLLGWPLFRGYISFREGISDCLNSHLPCVFRYIFVASIRALCVFFFRAAFPGSCENRSVIDSIVFGQDIKELVPRPRFIDGDLWSSVERPRPRAEKNGAPKIPIED